MTNEIESTEEFDTVRKLFVEDEESWYYVVVDVIEKLTQTPNPSRYWTDIKRRVQRQANRLGREELYDFIVKFPFKHPSNNRTYQFDCANQAGSPPPTPASRAASHSRAADAHHWPSLR